MYRYVSIDIETLGLDESYCDIIEFAAVIDDLNGPVEELPVYQTYLTKEDGRYQGEVFALAMHHEILNRIANRTSGYNYWPADCLDEDFATWLEKHHVNPIVLAGKNVANFDLKFLRKIGFGNKTKFHRRILDVGSMFYYPSDDVLPDLATCLKRIGIEKEIAHTATEDALDVIRCIRAKFNIK